MTAVLAGAAPTAVVELDLGDVAVFRAPFTVDGVPTDPTAVTWTVWAPGAPAGVPAAAGASHPGVGDYRLAVPMTAAGRWWAKATGTGAAAGAEAAPVWCRPDPPSPPR